MKKSVQKSNDIVLNTKSNQNPTSPLAVELNFSSKDADDNSIISSSDHDESQANFTNHSNNIPVQKPHTIQWLNRSGLKSKLKTPS